MGLPVLFSCRFQRKLVMECQEADVSGSSALQEHKSRPFDEVVVDYERFMSKQRSIVCSERAAEAHRGEVTGSSTFSREEVEGAQRDPAEVSFFGDLDSSVGIAPEDEGG
ncbi:hypothetical protein ACOSP7_019104 [Xanthoceras sorbifolium]